MGDQVEACAHATDSESTRAIDDKFRAELEAYNRRGAELGVAAAGEPPLDVAHHLTELRATCEPATGSAIQITGGTGTEWLTCWRWTAPSDQRVLVAVRSDLETVSIVVGSNQV